MVKRLSAILDEFQQQTVPVEQYNELTHEYAVARNERDLLREHTARLQQAIDNINIIMLHVIDMAEVTTSGYVAVPGEAFNALVNAVAHSSRQNLGG